MPRRNVIKVDVADTYYHVYARGVSKQPLFIDHADFVFFLNLWERYLSKEDIRDSLGMPYQKLHESVEVLAYCVMGNHFHALLYQKEAGGMQRLMRGIMTSYSRYFNLKYNRSGPLYESRYKASRITNEGYLQHITRYIHLNPKDWRSYPYSSIAAYIGNQKSDWLQPATVLAMFSSKQEYEMFVGDYEAAHRELEELQHELADRGQSSSW